MPHIYFSFLDTRARCFLGLGQGHLCQVEGDPAFAGPSLTRPGFVSTTFSVLELALLFSCPLRGAWLTLNQFPVSCNPKPKNLLAAIIKLRLSTIVLSILYLIHVILRVL